MDFDAKKINEVINDYVAIQCLVHRTNFTVPQFKKLFNRYYKLRQKKAAWYNNFYDVFKNCKRTPKSFEELMISLYEKTKVEKKKGKKIIEVGEIHPSFCSKILHTLDPNKPIWDKYVLQWLGIVLKDPKDPYERMHYYATIYEQIEKEYNEHLNDKNIIEAMKRFDKEVKLPVGMHEIFGLKYIVTNAYRISPVKKLDFMLWSNRSDRTVSILDYNKLLDSIKK